MYSTILRTLTIWDFFSSYHVRDTKFPLSLVLYIGHRRWVHHTQESEMRYLTTCLNDPLNQLIVGDKVKFQYNFNIIYDINLYHINNQICCLSAPKWVFTKQLTYTPITRCIFFFGYTINVWLLL